MKKIKLPRRIDRKVYEEFIKKSQAELKRLGDHRARIAADNESLNREVENLRRGRANDDRQAKDRISYLERELRQANREIIYACDERNAAREAVRELARQIAVLSEDGKMLRGSLSEADEKLMKLRRETAPPVGADCAGSSERLQITTKGEIEHKKDRPARMPFAA